MKLPSLKKSKHFFLLGLSFLILCIFLVLYLELWLTAPNNSTLIYRQSILLPVAVVLLAASIAAFIQAIRLRRAKN
jgi:hypothetical protein